MYLIRLKGKLNNLVEVEIKSETGIKTTSFRFLQVYGVKCYFSSKVNLKQIV